MTQSTPRAQGIRDTRRTLAENHAVTFFRPLKRDAVPRLRDLRAFVEELQPCDEVIFGLEETEAVLTPSLLTLAEGDHRIKIVRCQKTGIPNRKVAKLMQMTAQASHHRWVLFDSEAVPSPALLHEVRVRLDDATAVTAAYHFSDLRTLPQLTDAMSTLTFLLVGDAWSRFAGRPTAVFGACLAITRRMWEELGGWERFGHELADDFQVGRALRARGVRLHRCQEPVLLRADPLGWRHFWNHQLRAAATYRVSKPAGFAGAAFVFALPLMLSVCLSCRRTGWLGAFAVWLTRAAIQIHFNRSLRIQVAPGMVLLLTPVLLFTEFAAWVASWFSSRVRWGNQEFEVGVEGVMRETNGTSPQPYLRGKRRRPARSIFHRLRRPLNGRHSTSTGIPVMTTP